MQDPVFNDTFATCELPDGTELLTPLTHLARFRAVVQLNEPDVVLQLSQALPKVKITARGRTIYSGRAVVAGLVPAGAQTLCEFTLDEQGLTAEALEASTPAQRQAGYAELLQHWQKLYCIEPEYKIIVADIQNFLHELSHWAEQLSLGQASASLGQEASAQRELASELTQLASPTLNAIFDRFELAAAHIPKEAQGAHAVYARRCLHPYLMESPFLHRTYRKPLGYPGDYEMVSMILRDPREGRSLFAQVINHWILNHVPARGHRNRILLLRQRFMEEGMKARARGVPLRVYNLGCGPAREVLDFIRESGTIFQTEFTLLDFNEETLASTESVLREACRRHNASVRLRFIKKSVAHVLKEATRGVEAGYDLVYCAGLFDYLPDRVCRQLMTMFNQMLVPGGLLISTNVSSDNPLRGFMDYLCEWHLIYRNANDFMKVAPENADPEDCRIICETSGSNLFLEVRKPPAQP